MSIRKRERGAAAKTHATTPIRSAHPLQHDADNNGNRSPHAPMHPHRCLAEDCVGGDLRDVMRSAANQLYAHYGEDPTDDRSYRYPLR